MDVFSPSNTNGAVADEETTNSDDAAEDNGADSPSSTTDAEKKPFVFSDTESALLLNVGIKYKEDMRERGKNWETVREKYVHLCKRFLDVYPSRKSEDFPNADNLAGFTKSRVKRKFQKLKAMHKLAVDNQNVTKGGRLCVLLWNNLEELWGSPPEFVTPQPRWHFNMKKENSPCKELDGKNTLVKSY